MSIFQRLFQKQCDGRLTIRGLWPLGAQWCGRQDLDLAELIPLRRDLEASWPSCRGIESEASLWSHEWDRHAACWGFTQPAEFFALALQLFQ
jgi:ribonuclease I